MEIAQQWELTKSDRLSHALYSPNTNRERWVPVKIAERLEQAESDRLY